MNDNIRIKTEEVDLDDANTLIQIDKNLYYEKLANYYAMKPNKKPFTREMVSSAIQQILGAKLKKHRKDRREYYLLRTYDVLINGSDTYLIKKKNNKNSIHYIVCYEDLFDTLHEIHLFKTGHGGRLKMENASKEMVIPRPAMEIFLSCCQLCKERRSITKSQISRVIPKQSWENVRLDVLDFQEQRDQDFGWILRYQDMNTKFLVLRPLKDGTLHEVVRELIHIFATLGVPRILCNDNAQQIIEMIQQLWPDIIVVPDKTPETDEENLLESLKFWMKENSNNWSIGLSLLQWQKNHTETHGFNSSPYKMLYGLEQIPTKSPENDGCDDNEDEDMDLKLCEKCKKSINMDEHLHCTNSGIFCSESEPHKQDIELKKPPTMNMVIEEMDEFDVGDTVFLKLPKLQPNNPPNLICIIIQQSNGVNRLACKNGILKGWFDNNSLLKSGLNLITIKDVDMNKFITIQEAMQ